MEASTGEQVHQGDAGVLKRGKERVMTGFYVEVWQPTGQKAEEHAKLATFKEAVAWLDDRLAADPQRLPRMLAYTNAAQEAEMLRRNMVSG
jgi:hypothetical protein